MDCLHKNKSDFSFYRHILDTEKTKHIYCHDCKAHYYDKKWYSKAVWERWINWGQKPFRMRFGKEFKTYSAKF